MSTEETTALLKAEKRAKAAAEQRRQGIWTVAEAKKLWGYRKKEDGTIWIFSCKSSDIENFPDGVFRIPAQIGRTLVSEYGERKGRTSLYPNGCPPCTRAELPKGLSILGSYAFWGFHTLKEICLPEGLKRIEDYALANVELEHLLLPASLEDVALTALQDVRHLKVEAGSPHFYIQNDCLCRQDGQLLLSAHASGVLKVPEGIQEIGEDAIRGCTGLTQVELPDSVQRIHRGGFYCFRCSSHVIVTIHCTDIEIDESGFQDCPNLMLRSWPGSTTEVYARAHKLSFEAL